MADTTIIKPDPEDEKPGVTTPMEEDDLYEDAGDLEFYDKNATGHQFETLYLARVPKYMWDAWLKMTDRLGDDDEIQIGTLRTWNEPVADASAEGGTRDVTKLRMLLEPNCPEHQLLPREYDLEILDRDVHNHFIFSEEDLPSYKAKNKERAEAASAGIPASLLRQRAAAQAQANGRDSGPQRHTYDRRSRFQPYYRKAIPSQLSPMHNPCRGRMLTFLCRENQGLWKDPLRCARGAAQHSRRRAPPRAEAVRRRAIQIEAPDHQPQQRVLHHQPRHSYGGSMGRELHRQ